MTRLRQHGAFFVAIAVGFAFGAADQYLGSRVITLGPWASTVSQLSAPWLILAFVAGSTQARSGRAALLGLVATMAGLTGYFAMMWSPVEGVPVSQLATEWPTLLSSQWLNIAGGLLSGPLFGYLGQRWRVHRWWPSAALVAGALCLEPLARWVTGRLWPPAFVWGIEVAVGVTLMLVLCVLAMTRDRQIS